MKIFIMIGWRNLWRNKRRSLVVISSIGLGIFAMILSVGIMNGMNNQMVENTIRTSLGHVSIQHRGFQEDMSLENSFTPPDNLYTKLGTVPGLIAFSPRIKLEGMIQSSEASRGVLITGIDPERETSLSDISSYMLPVNGSRYLSDPDAHDMLISRTMSEKLDIGTGDKGVLMFQDLSKEIVAVAFKVRGLYQSPVESFDRYVVYTGIEAMGKLTGLNRRISELSVRVDHRDVVDSVKQQIQTMISDPSIAVLSWKDMAPNLLSAIKLFDTSMYIFFAIVFVTVIFSVANTLIMAIMERFHEIGVMKSIGTRPSWVFAMVLFEAVNLGIVGLAAGTLVGSSVIAVLSVTGIDFSFYAESMRVWGTGTIIYPSLKPMDILASIMIVLATTLIAAVYPAAKAARIKPLDALHYI